MANEQLPDLGETLKRLVEIETQVCAEIGIKVTAFPRFLATGNVSNYWTNRVGSVTTDDAETGEEFQTWNVQIFPRFVGFRQTEGLKGTPEDIIYRVIPKFIATINALEGLQSMSFPDTQQYLEWQENASASGYAEFSDTGTGGALAVGAEFTLNLTFVTERIQRTTK